MGLLGHSRGNWCMLLPSHEQSCYWQIQKGFFCLRGMVSTNYTISILRKGKEAMCLCIPVTILVHKVSMVFNKKIRSHFLSRPYHNVKNTKKSIMRLFWEQQTRLHFPKQTTVIDILCCWKSSYWPTFSLHSVLIILWYIYLLNWYSFRYIYSHATWTYYMVGS